MTPDKKVNIVLDATMLDLFMLCECRFNYRMNLHKETPTRAKPLDRGTVVHTGMETYYGLLKLKVPYRDAVKQALEKAEDAALQSDLEMSVVRRCLDVIEENLEYWRVSDQGLEINEVEKSFSYILHEDEDMRIIMIGKIDLLISDNVYSGLPVDHKSYDREFPVRRLNNQFMNYCVATQSNFLLVNKIGFQTSLKAHEKYKRIPVSYDSIILEEWKQNVILWANKYLVCVATGKWPLNTTSCDKYNRACEYLEVCESSGQEAKQYKLEVNFKTGEPWDVSKILGKKE